jgi:hypothetical protein
MLLSPGDGSARADDAGEVQHDQGEHDYDD